MPIQKVIALVEGVLTEISVDIPSSSGGSSVPTTVPSNSVYSVGADTQVLFSEEIDLLDGAEISINGSLVEV
jgi:hypothetical protein